MWDDGVIMPFLSEEKLLHSLTVRAAVYHSIILGATNRLRQSEELQVQSFFFEVQFGTTKIQPPPLRLPEYLWNTPYRSQHI